MKLTSLALVLALLPAALFAAGGNSGTTTTSAAPTVIPGGAFTTTYVISASGSYVLGGSRSTPSSLYVIQIAAPDVTLDLNGFKLSNTAGANTDGGGIKIPTPENVEIRNGSIIDPGYFGIATQTGKNVRIINVRIMGAGWGGIYSGTDGALVERCHVADSKGYGMFVNGAGSLVTDCVVNGIGTASGIQVAAGSRVVRSVVRGGGNLFLLYSSTAVDCIASLSVIGFIMQDESTLRGVESIKNTTGVYTYGASSAIMGSRISGNTANFAGATWINGGGNVIY
jgi:hypothetical protein